MTVSESELKTTRRRVFRRLIKQMPMSQGELAKRLGVSHSTVAHWCRGPTTPYSLMFGQVLREIQKDLTEIQANLIYLRETM